MDKETGVTAAEATAASTATAEPTLDDLAAQISGPAKDETDADKGKASKEKAKVPAKSEKEKDEDKPEPEDEDEKEEKSESEDEDDSEDDSEDEDESEDEEESDDEDEETDEDEDDEDDLTEAEAAAEKALEKAIENGKLPLGLRKRLEKAEAKVEEAVARAEEAERKMADADKDASRKPVGKDVSDIRTASDLREFEKKSIAVKDFCDDQLEMLETDPASVEAELRANKVSLKSADGEEDYSPATMKRWLLTMRRQARVRLSDEIPQRREEIEAEAENDKAVAEIYPALKDRKSPLAQDVQKLVKEFSAQPFTSSKLNASKSRIAIWILRGRQAELADFEAAKVKKKEKSGDDKAAKPKVKSPSPKGGGGGGERASRREQTGSSFAKADTESGFAGALAASMSGA